MKVIFLDIDGVLNSDRSIFALPMREIKPGNYRYNYLVSKVDPVAVAILNKIVKDTGAKLVGSTSNRKVLGFEGLAEVLKDMGVEGELIGITASLNARRGVEIKDWLEFSEMAFCGGPVESYVILDDSDDMLDEQQDNFVRVNPTMGLSFSDMRKSVAILTGSEPTSLILL